MIKKMIFALVLVLVLVYGCAESSELNFKQGVKKLNEFDKKYGATLKSGPNSTALTGELIVQITGFAAANKMDEPLKNLIDFKIKFLEAEKLSAEGWQWGRASTTDYGFGCKGYKRIKESAKLRNMSAQKGYEALGILQNFVDKYPKEAESINLSKKDALFLNAQYFQIEEKARKDAGIIEGFCGEKARNQTTEENAA